MIRLFPFVRAACAPLAALLLASCGGGTQVEQFRPTRLIVFGDETSALDDSGQTGNARKYTVNALKDDKVTLDCELNPIWVQTLATGFGLTFTECNPNNVAAPANLNYAVDGAGAADVAAQVASHLQGDTFSNKDLVTMLAGAKEILAQYDAVKGGTAEADAAKVLEDAGKALAAQVNDVATRGGKVLISLVPDLGLTPFATTENTATAGRAALLSRLTAAFNQALRLNIINDGRMIGLLLTDELVQAIYKGASLASTTYVNATTAACDVTEAPLVQNCSTETLVTGATSANYLWADATHLSAGGQLNLGQMALSRATGNPF